MDRRGGGLARKATPRRESLKPSRGSVWHRGASEGYASAHMASTEIRMLDGTPTATRRLEGQDRVTEFLAWSVQGPGRLRTTLGARRGWVPLSLHTTTPAGASSLVPALMSCGLIVAHIHPACLPMHGQTFSLNENCWITGFGKTKETDGERQRC